MDRPAIFQEYRDTEALADRTLDAARDALIEADFDLALEQLRAAEAHVVEAARLYGLLPVA